MNLGFYGHTNTNDGTFAKWLVKVNIFTTLMRMI